MLEADRYHGVQQNSIQSGKSSTHVQIDGAAQLWITFGCQLVNQPRLQQRKRNKAKLRRLEHTARMRVLWPNLSAPFSPHNGYDSRWLGACTECERVVHARQAPACCVKVHTLHVMSGAVDPRNLADASTDSSAREDDED
eukprot:2840398-Prymnesium_polylepis.1